MIKLKKGDKVIERQKVDYEKNQSLWTLKGFSLVEEKISTDEPKKKAPKKKKSK
tara:strand:- start:3 stop:164 length:162 start_codon:yes stop_codon:yes gene_type:complete